MGLARVHPWWRSFFNTIARVPPLVSVILAGAVFISDSGWNIFYTDFLIVYSKIFPLLLTTSSSQSLADRRCVCPREVRKTLGDLPLVRGVPADEYKGKKKLERGR